MLALPGQAFSSKDTCLAVWCNPEVERFWPSMHPDVLRVPQSWDEFDDFLKEVKKKAHGRHIILDLDVHGSGKYLALQVEDARTDKTYIHPAGFGYAVNRITKILGTKNIEVVCESCFAGETYRNSIRGNKVGQNHPGIPKFPIYGASYNMYNINNLVYLQYATGCHVWFEDLRKYEKGAGQARIEDEKNPEYDKMIIIYRILGSMYDPDMPQP